MKLKRTMGEELADMRSTLTEALKFFGYLFLALFLLRGIFRDGVFTIEDLAPMYKIDQLYRPFELPWDHLSNLGVPNTLLGNLVYNLPLILLSKLLGSVTLAHKIYLVLLVALGGFGQCLLFERLFEGKNGFFAGMFYLLSPWTAYRLTRGHNLIIMGSAFLPYVFITYLSFSRNHQLTKGVLCSALATLLMLISPHMAYLFFIVLAIYGFASFLSLNSRLRKLEGALLELTKHIVLVLQVLILTISLGMPVIMLNFSDLASQVNVIRPEELGFYTLRPELLVQEWANVIQIALFLALFLILLLKKRWLSLNTTLLFSVILMLVGGSLSFGGVRPLRPLVSWLFRNFPGFTLFRELNKFLYLLFFGYSILFGSIFEKIYEKTIKFLDGLSKRGMNLRGSFFFGLFIIIALLAAILPDPSMASGDLGGKLSPVELPDYFVELDNWLRSQEGDFRVAFFPPACWASTYNWSDKWFLDPLVALQAKPTVEVRSEMDITPSNNFVRWAYMSVYNGKTNRIGRLFGLMGVKYVIFRPDADMPEDRLDLFELNREGALEIFNRENDLELEKRIGCYTIYRNPYALPLLLEGRSQVLIVGDRRVLIALSYVDSFDFSKNPCIFLDNSYESNLTQLLPEFKYIIFDPLRELDLALALLKNKQVIRPWELIDFSGEMKQRWVRGDFAWHLYGGRLHVAPDNYVMTHLGDKTLSFTFSVPKDGNYTILIQVFETSFSWFGNISIRVDGSEVFINSRKPVSTKIEGDYIQGDYVWENIGNFTLLEGKHELEVKSVGGAAAISKILVVPTESIKNLLSLERFFLNSSRAKLVFLFEEESWAFNGKNPQTYLSSDRFSNGRAVYLSYNMTTNPFFIPRDGKYFIVMRAMSPMGIETNSSIIIDESHEFEFKVTNRSMEWLRLGPVELDVGYHTLKLRPGNGPVAIDLIILYEMSDFSDFWPQFHLQSPSTSELRYVRKGSSYQVEVDSPYLLFLETYNPLWELSCDYKSRITPFNLFSFGNMYKLMPNMIGKSCYLNFRGSDLVKRGFLLGTIMATITLLSMYVLRLKFRLASNVEGLG